MSGPTSRPRRWLGGTALSAGLLAAAVAGGAVLGGPGAATAADTTLAAAASGAGVDTAALPGAAACGGWGQLEHGTLTLRAAHGTRTVDLQRGTISAVGPQTVSVRSADGFTATYQVTAATRVRLLGHGRSPLSALATGDGVAVIADHASTGDDVARRVTAAPAGAPVRHRRCARGHRRGQQQGAGGTTVAPSGTTGALPPAAAVATAPAAAVAAGTA